MEKKPILYYQADSKGNPIWDFAAIAKMGAEELGVKTVAFEEGWEIPIDPYHIVVGSVEETKDYLEMAKIEVPSPIDVPELRPFLKRKGVTCNIGALPIMYKALGSDRKVFVKPATSIKSFTGQVVFSEEEMMALVSDCNSDERFLVQPVIDIDSEYRLYVRNDRIIGMKHYLGDPLLFPDPVFITKCLNVAKEHLYYTHKSYTLDFGVDYAGNTMLIEANDAWAIGNYGLEPKDYYYFARDRWLQITGIL